MRAKIGVVILAVAILGAQLPLRAQRPVDNSLSAPQTKNRTPPPSVQAAAAGDRKSVLFNWMWYMGMLRRADEAESIATLEIWKSEGTVRVGDQPCKLMNYRASLNYQISGMRAQYTCTLPNGQDYKGIEVVSGQYAWDEDIVGAGLEPGRGTATPKPGAVTERLIRIWAGPQGAVKAAAMAGDNTKVSVEGGKAVVTYPIPGVPGAIAKATLNAMNEAERVEVRQGNVVTEFTYEDYADHNPPDDRVDAEFAGHIVEKRDGVTLLDLNVSQTETMNIYVIMPVPESVRTAFASAKR